MEATFIHQGLEAFLLDKGIYYDREKYLYFVLDVAETVLGIFGFDRKGIGFRSRTKDFLEEIWKDREREILSELQSLMKRK